VQADANHAPKGGQIGGVARISAMHGAADVATRGAAGLLVRAVRGDADGVRVEARDVIDAATREGTELLHARW
jgi:hypothetical protein